MFDAFALVKSHILDLGAFQFDMTRSLLPAVLPRDHSGRHRSICGRPWMPSVCDSSPQW